MSKALKKSLAVVLTFMMVFSFFSLIAPVKVNALPATDSTYTNSGIYSTPPFSGRGDRWFMWFNGKDDYVKVYYPSHVYLDVTETLQSAGYHFDVEWHYGSNTDYRILLGAPVWGDNAAYSGLPAKYYTMTNIFSDYKVDASLPPNAPGGPYGATYSGSATDYDLRIVGYGHANQGSDGFSYNNARHDKYVLWRNNTNAGDPVWTTIYLMGKPSSSYKGTTTEYNTSGASVGSYGLTQHYVSGGKWNNDDNAGVMFQSKGSQSSYMEGQWIEMQWFVTVYDKSELSNTITNAGQVVGQQQSYGEKYVVAGRYSDLTQHYNEAVALVSTREVTQNDIDSKKNELYNAATALYYGADNSELRALVAEAEAIMAASDYTLKYNSLSRNNLEVATSAAKAISFYNSAPRYQAYTNSDAGRRAESDQTTIDSFVADLRTAISGLTKASYTVKFTKLDGTVSSPSWIYGYNIPDRFVENSVKEPDAANHYTVKWDKEINRTVTGAAEYTEIAVAEAHDWNDWYTTVYPSCTNEGSMYRTCKICNYRQDDKIPAVAHTELPPVITNEIEATCKSEGSYVSTIYCNDCGNQVSQQTVVVPKKQHTAGEKVKENVIEASCTENGSYEEVVYCSVCDKELTRKTVPVGAAHKNSDPYITREESTCSKAGVIRTTVFCTVCSTILSETTENLPLADHKPGEAKKENEVDAGCESPGSYDMVTRCTVCNEVLDSDHFETEAGSHDWDEWETVSQPDCENDGIQRRVCKNDPNHIEEKPIPTEGHKYTFVIYPPTCTKDGYTEYTCSVCNDVYTDNTVTTDGHTPKAAVIEKAVEATCTVAAYHEEVVYCSVCDAEISRTPVKGTTIPHTEEKIPAVAPDCDTDGMTEGVKCSVCNKVLVAPVTDPAKGHTEEEIEAIPPTCTADGWTAGVKCSVCNEVLDAPEKDPMLGHDWDEWFTVTPASCGTDGEEKRICKNDAEHFETKTIYATGEHVYATEKEKVEATCTVDGYVIKACLCGAEETTVFKADGHKEEKIPAVAPDCDTDGYTAGVKCSVCNEVLVSPQLDPAKGHAEEEIEAIPPTCTADGWTAGVKCSVCDTVLEAPVVDPSEGHSPKAAVIENEIEATCKVAAYHEEVVYCAVCDTLLSRTPVTGSTLPHTEETIPAVAPDCDTDGFTAGVKCSECGDILVAPAVDPKTGHTPKDAVIENEVEATCKVAAYHEEVVYCAVCDKEISRTPVTGSTLPHTEETLEAVAPSCTATGLTEGKKCTVCGDITVAQTTVSALGHKYGEWEEVQAPTCTEAGIKKAECTVCGDVKTEKIEKTEHAYDEDGICADCGTNRNCNHLCHRAETNIFAKIVWSIIRFICSIFGIGHTCSCGVAHY